MGVSNNASLFGYSDSGMNVTFSDGAANSIQYYQNYTNPAGGQLVGTWQPEGVNIDPLTNNPAAFLTAGQTAMLGSLAGEDANGVWTLFLADLSAGRQSTVVSWSLNIDMVPEPQSWALGVTGLLMLAGVHRWTSRKSQANRISNRHTSPY